MEELLNRDSIEVQQGGWPFRISLRALLALFTAITISFAGIVVALQGHRELAAIEAAPFRSQKTLTSVAWVQALRFRKGLPAYIADDSGRPMHSWRAVVLMLVPWEDCQQSSNSGYS